MAVFTAPKYIFTGEDALALAIDKIVSCGKKALIVTGPHVGKSAGMRKLTLALENKQQKYVIFDQITGEPTDTMIQSGVQCLKEHSCDYLIGFGGGSPLDAAKAIGLMANEKGKLSDFFGNMIEANSLPVIAIPTTAGTGSEATKFTVITDEQTQVKMLLKGDCLLPKIAVVDPSLTLSASKDIIASTGLDALTHAIEAYTSVKASPLTDALSISAVKRIMKNLPIAFREEEHSIAIGEMSMAALEAGLCINNSSVTLVHGLSRPIGAIFHVPHGLSNAMLLPAALGFALDGTYERFALLGRETKVANEWDNDKKAAEKFLLSIEEICKICQVPTLEEYGIKKVAFEESIMKMSQDSINSGSPSNTRKEVTLKDCQTIYQSLFACSKEQ